MGLVNAHSQAIGHSSPPNTSDSRHSTWIASFCGWWRFSAIFSGSTCTIQNSTIAAIGITMTTNQATPQDTLSISAGGRNDACAAGAASSEAAAAAARRRRAEGGEADGWSRSEEHTSELQS